MKAHRAEFPVRAMCRVPGLSPGGYYVWLKRTPPERARRDAELREKIEDAWERADGPAAGPGSMRNRRPGASGWEASGSDG